MNTLNETSYGLGMISCKADYFIFCVLLYTFLISLTLVTVVGNLLVIISIIHFKQLHSPTNYLILSLAVADLLIGLVVFPFNMAFSLRFCLQRMVMYCKIRYTFDYIISVTSVLNLCCISIDRYYAVCQPLMYKSKITDQVVRVMITLTWLIAFICGMFVISMLNYFDNCTEFCFLLIYILGVCTYFFPSLVLICVYSKIYLASQKQARSIQNATSRSGAVASKKEKKATKTLAIVMGLFLICWTPFFMTYPFQLLSTVVVYLTEPLNWFAMSNSMFNPFIYAFFYRWFRTAFRMIISGKIFQANLAHTKLH